MNNKILTVVGITILFLGLSIQPSIATVQPKGEIVVEPDVEGLVAQLRVVINKILQTYGHNPIIRSLCNMILDLTWFPGKNIICGTLLFLSLLILSLCVNLALFFNTDMPPYLSYFALFLFII